MVARGPRRDRLPSVPTSPGVRVGGVRRSGRRRGAGTEPVEGVEPAAGPEGLESGQQRVHRRPLSLVLHATAERDTETLST